MSRPKPAVEQINFREISKRRLDRSSIELRLFSPFPADYNTWAEMSSKAERRRRADPSITPFINRRDAVCPKPGVPFLAFPRESLFLHLPPPHLAPPLPACDRRCDKTIPAIRDPGTRQHEPPSPSPIPFFFKHRESESWKVSSPLNCLSFNCDPWMISAITLIVFIGLIKFQRKTTWKCVRVNDSLALVNFPSPPLSSSARD